MRSPSRMRSSRSRPLEILHGEERRAVLLAEVEDGDDVAVRELRRGARFAEEAFALLWLASSCAEMTLTATTRVEQGIERSCRRSPFRPDPGAR